ncbi:MAG: polar amino acid transport system substrate-binding protein [Solirubrobacterales bacterium]|jgi:polar amino acid transport system substrate-binding protein|nr:polar amino acid transport system substrate-binding protein [Solirubrobacterales bacterium]
MRPRLTALIAAIAFAAVTVAAGCGSSNNSTTTGGATLTATPGITQQADQSIVAKLPASVKSSGELTVAADATYPPDEFIGSGSKAVIGMDADLANAIAGLMGLKASVQNVTFDSIIPGLAAGKYDLGISSFTDTLDREKVVDFVDYLTAGTSVFAKASGGPDITSLDELCGHTIAAEKGTTQQDQISKQDTKCKSEGKPGVTPAIFETQSEVNLALSSGRADAAMADTPVAAYIVEKSNGQFKLTSGPIPPEPYGIAIPKNSGMTQPVFDAIKALMDNGTYKKILAYWGLSDGAIAAPTINHGVAG